MPPAKSPAKLDLGDYLPYLVNRVGTVIAEQFGEDALARHGLSIAEWRVLAVLARSPGLAAADCAERTAMDKVAVSRAVGALLRAARLERRVARADRRRSVLRLTPAGRHVHATVAPVALAYERSLLKSLTRAERIALDRSLHILLGRAMQIGPLAKG